MNKLLSVIVAAVFAAMSLSAFAASHAGAPMKDDKKMEKKKGDKKAAKKKSDKKMDKMDKK
jgi:anaerobic C4-dicarboxylate transporter